MQLLIRCIMMYDALAVFRLTNHHFVTKVLLSSCEGKL